MTSIVFLDRDSLPTAVPPLPLPHRWQDYPATSPEQLLSHASGAQVLISNKVPLHAEHFAQLPELKLVAVAATGVNQIDLDAARAHGVAVCNVRNYGADAVAEHALMLMLALSRNLFAYRRAVLEGGWQQSAQFCLHAAPMKDLSARTLAVCGVMIRLGSSTSSSGLPWRGGSVSSTSSPAPPSRPACKAASNAASSTSPPRAVLISSASGFIKASSAAPIRPRVSSFNGKCKLNTSASASAVSNRV